MQSHFTSDGYLCSVKVLQNDKTLKKLHEGVLIKLKTNSYEFRKIKRSGNEHERNEKY